MSKKGLNLIFNFVLQQLNFKISIQDESKSTGNQNKTFSGRKKCLYPLIPNWIVFIVNGIYNRILDLLEKLSLGSKQFSIIKQKHGSRYTCIYAA